jgi:hypothetical protein
MEGEGLSEREKILNRVLADTNWAHADQRSDALTYNFAEAYFERKHPRVLYLGFGETDEWAHAGGTTWCSRARTGSTGTWRGCGRRCRRRPSTRGRPRS